MSERYFPHDHGYVHLMTDRVVFTRSGNWQEAREAPERRSRSKSAHTGRIIIGALLILAGGVFLKGGHALGRARELGPVLTFGLIGLGVLGLYSGLRRDFGPLYSVPYSRIIAVEPDKAGFSMRFLNGELKQDSQSITCPEEVTAAVVQALREDREAR